MSSEPSVSSGFLCRCTVCGREERTGDNPLKNGWPMCHGYTMTLIDTQRFIDGIDNAMGEVFEPVRTALASNTDSSSSE